MVLQNNFSRETTTIIVVVVVSISLIQLDRRVRICNLNGGFPLLRPHPRPERIPINSF